MGQRERNKRQRRAGCIVGLIVPEGTEFGYHVSALVKGKWQLIKFITAKKAHMRKKLIQSLRDKYGLKLKIEQGWMIDPAKKDKEKQYEKEIQTRVQDREFVFDEATDNFGPEQEKLLESVRSRIKY
jgi:hypothetical protein